MITNQSEWVYVVQLAARNAAIGIIIVNVAEKACNY